MARRPEPRRLPSERHETPARPDPFLRSRWTWLYNVSVEEAGLFEGPAKPRPQSLRALDRSGNALGWSRSRRTTQNHENASGVSRNLARHPSEQNRNVRPECVARIGESRSTCIPHTTSVSIARSDSAALEIGSSRGAEVRRTWTICATMLNAISSGVSADKSSPAGLTMRARAGSLSPASDRAPRTAAARRRLPARPTYIAWDPASSSNALPSYFPIVATTAYVSGVTISGIRARSLTIRSASCEDLSPTSVVTRTVR